MTSNTFFEIFLLIDVFIMGVIATFIVRHALAHYRPDKHAAEPRSSLTEDGHIPEAVRAKLLKESEEKIETTLNRSAQTLQSDLDATLARVNNMVEHLASNIISGELERYQSDLAVLHKSTEADLSKVKTQVDQHQKDIQTRIAQEFEAEKQRLIAQIDTKLADAVGSFLTEALQHNIDLGSQSAYLVSLLEEHKADFVKGVDDGTKAT